MATGTPHRKVTLQRSPLVTANISAWTGSERISSEEFELRDRWVRTIQKVVDDIQRGAASISS